MIVYNYELSFGCKIYSSEEDYDDYDLLWLLKYFMISCLVIDDAFNKFSS